MAEPKDQDKIYVPSAGEQRDAYNAWQMAQAQLKNAEKMSADATSPELRVAALNAVHAAQAEIKRVREKYGRILDWQQAEAAKKEHEAASAAPAVEQSAPVAAAPAAPAVQVSAAPTVKKHVVQKGESLSLIAKQYYGDIHKWKQLYEANKALIGDNPDRIQPGQELVIPD